MREGMTDSSVPVSLRGKASSDVRAEYASKRTTAVVEAMSRIANGSTIAPGLVAVPSAGAPEGFG